MGERSSERANAGSRRYDAEDCATARAMRGRGQAYGVERWPGVSSRIHRYP
jgi:hypothetical protein